MAAPTVVFATENLTSSGIDQNGDSIPVFQGVQSGLGEAESMTRIAGDDLMPPELVSFNADGLSASTADCNGWWLTGSHRWKWRGVTGLFVTNTLSASSNTFYGGTGSNFDSCGRPPLIVDRISVDARSRPINMNFPLRVDETAYNASYVDGLDRKSGSGSAGAQAICGAVVAHVAVKNGVTWTNSSRSGCG